MPGASHLVQSAAASQPQIVANGQLVAYPTWAGRNAVETNGGTNGANGSFIQTASPAPVPALSFPQPFARSSVLAFPWGLTPSNGNPIVLNSGNSAYIELYQTSTSTLCTYAYDSSGNSGGTGFTSVTGITTGTTGALLETINQANSSAIFNGAQMSGAVGAGASEIMSLGANVNGSARCTHSLYGEAIQFPQALASADQVALLTNQSRYWGTPFPYETVVLADNPYAYWPLTETSGTVANDVSGNGRNGTYTGAATLASGMLLPSTGRAYVALDGSTGYVNVTPAANFCAGSDWSIELWVDIAAMGAKGTAFLCFSSLTGLAFYAAGNGIDYQPQSGFAGAGWGGVAPAPGTLAHIVLSATGENYSGVLYVNGVAHPSATVYQPGISTLLGIGLPSSYTSYLQGLIGEVAVYNYALSAQQVATHYTAGIASWMGLVDSLHTPVVGAWSLRRLRGKYAGACLNVRRDSDSATKDIGFTATGDLDIAGLLAFVGTANGFVTTLYDQATNPSNASNLAQSNSARQPQIVTNGVLNTASSGSSRPAMLASATTSSLQELLANASKLTLSQPFSRACVTGIPSGATSSSFGVLSGSTNASVIALNAVNLKYQMYDYNIGFTSSNSVTAGAINSVTENYNTTASSIVVNGTTTNGSIGSGGDGIDLVFAGVLTEIASASTTLSEVIQFGALLATTDQSALYASQKSYWGTP